MIRLKNEIVDQIKEEMKTYIENGDSFELFTAEYGFADWMNEFTTAADGEPMTESECEEIDQILLEIWNTCK